ncbi:hypothetical protein BDK88_4074 [Natrinema hispanicum]|uniref:Uncharacterized protein n=1 Tax=Natrinema hispanicum TaxID=392421 RepID=A0A482Y8C5_9EURY|nr:hypothetical protein [Natrinema hispanicum]RZV06117.1 hypothetical protein BDK88_4074 [Natrinema hispanicum]
MPPLSRRALLATVVAGSSSGVAGCNALSKDSSSTPTSSDGFGGIPLYVAEGVPLPDGADVVTVDDPVGGHVALFPADLSDTEGALYALAGSTPVAVVGRDAQDTLMDICAADGRSYGFASNSWGPGTRVAAAVPLGDSLVTHLFNGSKIPNSLPQVLDRLRNPPAAGCTVDEELSTLPDGLNEQTMSLGVSYLHGRNDVARFDRRDTVRAATGTDQADLVVDIRGTIYAGSEVGGDGRYVADQVRLEASFDNHLSATAPPAGETENLVVQRDVDMADDALEHRFAPASDETRQGFTACQHSLVIAPEMPESFSYTANGRFRWRDPRFIRKDDRWHHHTPGRAVWYPNGGR